MAPDRVISFCNRCGDALVEGCDPKDELLELDALLKRLTIKRYDLKRKINQVHSPIVRQLPADVTSTIFEFCLPDFTDQLLSYTNEVLSIPLSLGAICSYWRNIAWSTPRLWSSLLVRVPVATGIVQEWLNRSGQLPLSIRIHSGIHDSEAVSALADIINQYSHRWSELDLHIPDGYYQYFHSTDNHAPILKLIRLQCSVYISSNVIFHLTCPRLERANISRLPTGGINIQWDNLTHLRLTLCSVDDALDILSRAPRLFFCDLFLRSRHGEPSIGAPVLTSLRYLQLLNTTSAEYFLNNLIAPHLEDFSLPRYYNPSMEVITSFLRRSSCSLRSISMISSTFPPYFEGFMNILQSMPSLNTLSIISITRTSYSENITIADYIPQNIMQLLARVLSSQSTSLQQGFLPNLKILEYIGNLNLSPGDRYCLPPADNAVHGPLNLLRLNLHPATRIPKNMISYLSSVVERGVAVNVLSNSEDILQSSIDYYKFRKDSLSRDWADNLDLSLFP